MKTMKKLLPMNLQMFAEDGGGEETPKFTFDDFKNFADSNEDAQKFLQSSQQAFADKSIESFKANNLDKIKQDAIKEYEDAKKNKTPEQQQLEKLQQDLAAEKALRVTNENKAFVAEQMSGLKLDDDLKQTVSDFMLGSLVSDNTDFTKKSVESFTGVLSKIQEVHADQLKKSEMNRAFGNRKPEGVGGDGGNEPSGNPMEDLEAGITSLLN